MKQTAMMTRLAVLVGAALVAVLALSGLAWAATTPLAVTKTVPGSGAMQVARTANVQAYFNHDMKASTITSSTFKIRKQGTTTWLGATRSVNNTISPTSTNGSSQSVATLNPNSDLAANTTYQVLIVGGSSGVKDVNGNALSANKSWTFTTVPPPDTTIASGPTGAVASTSATFAFSSSKPNSTFQCSLDNSTFAACPSPKNYSGPLNQGSHTFRVRAIDATGTQDPTPASRSWIVDTLVPDAPAITSPQENGFVGASFTLSGTAEPNATVEVFEGTTSKGTTQTNASGVWSKALSGVSEGAHIYTAKATDAAGNTSSASNARTVKVDTQAPSAPAITSPADNSYDNDGNFTLSGTAEANSTVTIFEGTTSKGTTQTDAQGNWSKALIGVAEGSHTYTAKATDAGGNTSSASNARTLTIDTTPPTVNNVSPANTATGVAPSTNVTATFSDAGGMDSSSIFEQTFTLKEQGSSSQLGASVSYEPTTKTATLNPSTDLTPNTAYTATLTTGVKDAAGNAMVQEKTWSFTTGANPVSSVTITPTTLDLSVTSNDPFNVPCEKTGLLTWTNNGTDEVDFWDVSITGPDAQYFSTGAQKLLLTSDYLGLSGGFSVKDEVKFTAGPTGEDRSRSYFATLTYKDGNGATIGSPVSLTATARCVSV